MVDKVRRSSHPCLISCRWLLDMVTEIDQSQKQQNIQSVGLYCCDRLLGGQLWCHTNLCGHDRAGRFLIL